MKDHICSQSIGIFDSGLGGLTVMKQITDLLPCEDVVYFGDTARLPYGEKSPETIIRYSLENAMYLIMKHKIKMLVVACNTASAYAIDSLCHLFNIPVVGVIEPGAEKAVAVTKNKRIAVLGTKGTIKSGIYTKEIEKRLPGSTVIGVACPLFVSLVEEDLIALPVTKMMVEHYLRQVKIEGVDTILLGCTHYPLLQKLIQDEVGDHITIVDSASICAEKVKSLLTSQSLENKSLDPKYTYVVSDDPEKFALLGSAFLGKPISEVATSST